jgi:phosphoglucosamine mutase
MINVPVAVDAGDRLADSGRVNEAVRLVEAEMQGRGRVILRPSGTEPLIRVTLEGPDEALVRRLAEQLADTVREEFGV